MSHVDPAKPLVDFKPTKKFFVGIDSDGCVFDTMGIKQRECFCPWMIAYFGLQPVASAARECKEFADLFSKTRGANRHKTVRRILMELLPSHPAVKERGFEVPKFKHYCDWVENKNSLLSDNGLKKAITAAADPEVKKELEIILEWSRKVNESVAAIVKHIPPFPYVRESLGKLHSLADMMVCSATPHEALVREWQEHNIDKYVNIIAGQEMGGKADHLRLAAKGKYPENCILMVGDAPGDMKAAKENGILFFPINPGSEAKSWKRFYEEGIDRFIKGRYAGSYEEKLIAEFDACLPEYPSWIR